MKRRAHLHYAGSIVLDDRDGKVIRGTRILPAAFMQGTYQLDSLLYPCIIRICQKAAGKRECVGVPLFQHCQTRADNLLIVLSRASDRSPDFLLH